MTNDLNRPPITQSGPNWGSYSEIRKLSQELLQISEEENTHINIMLAGNCNMDFLIPAINVNLFSEGITPKFSSATYNNWITETFSNDHKIDYWIIWLSSIGCTKGFTQQLDLDINNIDSACQRIVDNGSKVIVVLPEPNKFESDPFSEDISIRSDQIHDLQERLSKIVTFLSTDHLVRSMGFLRWEAPRYWEQAKLPCHPDAISWVGTELAITISRLFRPKIKAIVVDLDDTLWGGLVGEVGSRGILTDPLGSGRPFLELQRYLKEASRRGIPLAVVSKNDPEQAAKPFVENDEMVLQMSDFVLFEASWNPKFESILKIQQALNIGIESICFIDDSIQERNEARGLLPGLVVPEIPKSPGERVKYLIDLRLFTNPKVSAEDQSRAEFYKREQIPSGKDLEKYLADLEMIATATKIDEENFDRVFSLLHKTNQFNTSLWRPSINELRDFIASKSNYAFCFKLSDRLGEAGITSVLLAEIESGVIRIRSWVVSCRVFNRGFEWAIFNHLTSWAANNDVQDVLFDYEVGPRNAVIDSVFESIGIPKSSVFPYTSPVPLNDLRIPVNMITMIS